MGAPSIYTPDLAETICDRLASGIPLITICAANDMPASSVVRNWVLTDHDGFAAKYAHARELQLEVLADQVLTMSDECRAGVRTEEKEVGRVCSSCRRAAAWLHGRWAHEKDDTVLCNGADAEKVVEVKTVTADMVDRARLQVDSRKWLLSKLAAHKYGDRPAVAVNIDMRAEVEKRLEEIAFGGDQAKIEAWRRGEAPAIEPAIYKDAAEEPEK